MKKLSSVKKIISIVLAAVIVLAMSCSSSFALASSGGAMLYLGAGREYFADPAEAWSKYAALNEGAAFQLLGNWVADENGSFGEGVGFKDGAICLENKTHGLIFDFNGYSIDRGLENGKENGNVFFVENCKGMVFTNNHKIFTSYIKGGNNTKNGGAFVVTGSELLVHNIDITGNTTSGKGGAFYIEEGDNESVVRIDNCLVSGNKAKTGGAVYLEHSNTLKVLDSDIIGNFAKNDAGIHTEVDGLNTTHIFLCGKVTIADNFAEESGTGLMLDENFFRKVSVSYDATRPLSDASRITILSKTDDNTLRITADSSDTNFDCFEYENDGYRIVEKGSGDSRYLAIAKN